MSSLSESLWREGMSMDSSIFSDDDFLDWRWPASSPRRCDREGMGRILGMDSSTHRNSIAHTSSSCSSSSSSSSSNIEELFFYCTEELGSESTSGVVDLSVAPTTSGRSTHEEYNWAPKHKACGSSTCIKATSHTLEVEGASNIPSHAHMFEANVPHHHHHHHHCRTVSGGGDCTFPPPLASLLSDRPLMRSFKSNGRFILKKVANVSRSMFQSTRENGCLRLDLLPSSFDCLESQYPLFFPASSPLSPDSEDVAAESTSTTDFTHDYDHDLEGTPPPSHWLGTPSPYSFLLRHKPTLNYETMPAPSKLQAFAMLGHSKGSCSPLVEDSISTSSTSFQAGHLIKGQAGGNTAMVRSTPRVFALLKLLPSGLGLIIFEIGNSKGGDHITLYGMYILKNFGSQCSSRAAMSPSHHHLLTTSYGISSEDPKGKLFPFEDCKKERYMKGVFA